MVRPTKVAEQVIKETGTPPETLKLNWRKLLNTT